jgi:uncharacterized protein YgfB (UPF0149 family)
MSGLMEYGGVGQALHALGYGQAAAEYHGALCGMLCVHSGIPDEVVLSADYPPQADDEQQEQARNHLAELHAESLEALRDPDLGFSPLLPDDDENLASRVEALAQWCQGFLLGLSSQPALDLAQMGPDLREAVQDLVQISNAELVGADDGAAEDEDEASYTELLEYVRAAVQLLFLELNPGAPPAGGQPGVTVH